MLVRVPATRPVRTHTRRWSTGITEPAGLAELVAGIERRAQLAEESVKAAGASDVYAKLQAGRERLDPERSALEPLAPYSSVLELVERQLGDVEAGRDEFAPWPSTYYRR